MNQEKIWDYFQNNPDVGDIAFKADSRYQFLTHQVEPGCSVLNIGVGKGGLEKLLIAKKVNIHSLDPNKESIHNLQSNLNLGEKARVGFSQSIPFDDAYFDVVIMSEVLEHLSDDVLEKTIVECRRVLLPGGVFIGTVPAEEKLMESVVLCPDCGKAFHRWGHLQSFSLERINTMLSSEFSDPTIKRKYFGNWLTLNWKGKVGWFLKQTALFLGVKGRGETFFFSGKKQH